MKQHGKIFAGLLSAAVMLQNAAALPFVPAPTALPVSAVSTESMRARVFTYDFGTFSALYDTAANHWYDTEGNLISAATEQTQSAGYQGKSFRVDTKEKKVYDSTGKEMTQLSECAADYMEKGTEWVSYAPQYYDKAQQKYLDVPKPASFPLSFCFLPDDMDFGCEVYFGETLYCTLAFNSQSYLESGAALRGTAAMGKSVPFTDVGDTTVDGDVNVCDAVLSARVASNDNDAPITDLGKLLADQNKDGVVDANDTKDLLGVLVLGTSGSTEPEVTDVTEIPILSIEETEPVLDRANSYIYGGMCAGRENVFMLYDLVEGETDTLKLDYVAPATAKQILRIEQIVMDAYGTLIVRAGFTGTETAGSGVHHTEITLPHGALPEPTGVHYEFFKGTGQLDTLTVEKQATNKRYTLFAEKYSSNYCEADMRAMEDALIHQQPVPVLVQQDTEPNDPALQVLKDCCRDSLSVYYLHDGAMHYDIIGADLNGNKLTLQVAKYYLKDRVFLYEPVLMRKTIHWQRGGLPSNCEVEVSVVDMTEDSVYAADLGYLRITGVNQPVDGLKTSLYACDVSKQVLDNHYIAVNLPDPQVWHVTDETSYRAFCEAAGVTVDEAMIEGLQQYDYLFAAMAECSSYEPRLRSVRVDNTVLKMEFSEWWMEGVDKECVPRFCLYTIRVMKDVFPAVRSLRIDTEGYPEPQGTELYGVQHAAFVCESWQTVDRILYTRPFLYELNQ